MSIIYSYPEQSTLNAGDMLIGTSVEKVGGKQKNVTKNFTIQQIADFINRGSGFVDPVATDFQIPVFNQGGLKITGSIMSQDSSPSNGVAGTGITIAGSLTTTGNITTNANLSAFGVVTLGSQNNLISLNSITKLGGPIQDSTGTLGDVNQILLSTGTGNLLWTNYAAGLTYKGVWNANTNNPTLIGGTGINGHFYIVDVAGSTNLDGITDWKVGDWAVFVESGVTDTWQKIDNSSELTGSGTVNTLAMFTADKVLGDSLISQANAGLNSAVVSVNASLKVRDTVEATTFNTNLKLKGAGTGGVEIMSADGVTDGKIQLNCSVGTHGVTIQSPPHANNATYTLILPSSVGTVGQVLTSAGSGAGAQLTWSSPTVGTVTSINYTTDFTAFTAGPGTAITTAGVFTLNKNGGTTGQYIDGAAGAWVDLPAGDTYDLGSSTDGANVRLNLDAASGADSFVTLVGGTGITVAQAADVITLTGSAQGVTGVSSVVTGIPGLTLVTTNQNSTPVITLGLAATAGSNKYLDGGTGQWTTLPVSGVTSVTGDSVTIAATAGNTPVISAITAPGVALGNANLATGGQIQSAIDSALSGALIFRGTFNAATGAIDGGSTFLYQVTAGGAFDNSAARVAVAIGDFYIANVAGNFYGTSGTALGIGDEAIAITAYDVNLSQLAGWSVVPAQSSGGTVTGTGAATQVTFWDAASNVNGDTAFNWDNTNKRLGIGTVSPHANLDVRALTASSITNDRQTTTAGLVINGSNENMSLQFGVGGSPLNYGNWIQSSFDNGVPGSSPLYLNPIGGNVGIGTTAPISGFKLDVVGGDLRVADDATTNGFEAGYSAGGSNAFIQGYNRNTNVFTDMLINNSVTVKAGGSVGIGNINPGDYSSDANNLVVGSLSGDNGITILSGSNAKFGSVYFADATTNNKVYSGYIRYQHDQSDMTFGTNEVERMRITVNGDIKFSGNSHTPYIQLVNSGRTAASPGYTFNNDVNTGMFQPSGSADTIAFSTAGAERMRITSTGGVSFGSSGTGYGSTGQVLTSTGNASPTWQAAGGGGATITTRSTTTVNATTTVFALGATPNGGSTSFVDVFVDGVYQEINTYSVTGTTNITFGTALPSGVTVETKTTADYNVGAAVASVNGMTGSVLLNAPTLVTGNINALNGGLYIFDSATIYTLTLPTSPSAGDSIKISNGISGAANIIAPGSKKIMDVAGNMTINTPAAAFEMIFSGDANGWIIIGNV